MAPISVLFCFFSFYFWERDLEHHRHLASVFGISISHSSASYPPSHVTYSLVFNQAACSYDPRCFSLPAVPHLLLAPRTPAINSPHDTLPIQRPSSSSASHQTPSASHPPELRPHPLQSPSSPLLSLTPRSHLPRFHLTRFSLHPHDFCHDPAFPTQKTQPVPHIQPTHSCASRAPPSSLYKRPPFCARATRGGLQYPALSCNALRSGYFACRGLGLGLGWAGLDCCAWHARCRQG